MDLSDWVVLRGCLAGPESAPGGGCESSDLDCDADIDLRDVRILQLRFDGGSN